MIKYNYFTCIILLFIFLFNLNIYTQENKLVNINITSHNNNDIVQGYKHIIKGTFSKNKNSYIHILVHPHITNTWWIQSIPEINNDGTWLSCIYLGEYKRGNNEEYSIKAIISPEKLHTSEIIPLQLLPKTIVEQSIILRRKDKSIWKIVINPIFISVISIIITILFSWISIKNKKNK
jgi:hypothetical protein